MKSFFRIMGKYFAPYKGYVAATFSFNVLTALFNVVSFMLLVPILNILFKIDDTRYVLIDWSTLSFDNVKDVLVNNGYYYSQQLIQLYGPASTMLILGIGLAMLTLLKTGTYFAGSATLMPIKTGIVRDIRNNLYCKILSLPLSFFSEERKGDILARVSTDVNEVDSSIGSSLDMVIKNPIFLLVYISTLIAVSWQLTLFTLIVVPVMAMGIGRIGKSLSLHSRNGATDSAKLRKPSVGSVSSRPSSLNER